MTYRSYIIKGITSVVVQFPFDAPQDRQQLICLVKDSSVIGNSFGQTSKLFPLTLRMELSGFSHLFGFQREDALQLCAEMLASLNNNAFPGPSLYGFPRSGDNVRLNSGLVVSQNNLSISVSGRRLDLHTLHNAWHEWTSQGMVVRRIFSAWGYLNGLDLPFTIECHRQEYLSFNQIISEQKLIKIIADSLIRHC